MKSVNFKCPKLGCRYFSNNINQVKKHALLEHQLTRIVPCVTCGGKLFTYACLKRHRQNAHGPKRKCQICKKLIKIPINSHVHMRHRELVGYHEPLWDWKPLPRRPVLQRMTDIWQYPTDKKCFVYDQYVLVYNEVDMRPVCAFEDLAEEMIEEGKNGNRNHPYRENKELHWTQTTPEAIKFIGYENGHLAAARNHQNSPTACKQTFIMSNICPMVGGMNKGEWSSLEYHVRKLTKKWWAVRVFSGPIYNDLTNPPLESLCGLKVPVPTHFFKIIYLQRMGEDSVQAFIIPNVERDQSADIISRRATIEEIEKLTGMQFDFLASERLSWDLDSETKVYQCPKKSCCATYLSENQLNKHKLIHDLEFKCWVCFEVFDLQDKLNAHNNTHRIIKCRVEGCKYITRKKYLLIRHLTTHGPKTWKCHYPACEKSFKSLIDLNKHKKTHVGNRPWKCDVVGCGKDFARKTELFSHQNRHSGARPFKCEFPGCNQAFTSKNAMLGHFRHMHAENKKYKCDFENCDAEYNNKEQWQDHQDAHNNVNRWKCMHPGCISAYRCKSGLLRHQKDKNHKDPEPSNDSSQQSTSQGREAAC